MGETHRSQLPALVFDAEIDHPDFLEDGSELSLRFDVDVLVDVKLNVLVLLSI